MSSPEPLVIFPALTEHKATVIIAHGLGDSGSGYAPIIRSWQDNGLFHDIKFILPSAPAIPVTSAGGRSIPAWFDIVGTRGPHVTFDMLTKQTQDETGLIRSRDFFLNLIQDEVKTTSVSSSHIIIGGFSQGGVLSLLTGITSNIRLGGVFCLSGYLPLADAIQDPARFPDLHGKDANRDTPFVMIHGDRDPVMNLQWANSSADIVKSLGYPIDLNVIPGLGHSINQEVLDRVTAFITKAKDDSEGNTSRHDEL